MNSQKISMKNLDQFMYESFLKKVSEEILQIANSHELSISEFRFVTGEAMKTMEDLAIIPSKRRNSKESRYQY